MQDYLNKDLFTPKKERVTINVDRYVINYLKTHEGKYQTAINKILRDYVDAKLAENEKN